MLSSSINPEVGNMLLKNIERFLQDYKNDIYGGKQVDYSDIYYLWLISLTLGVFGEERDQEYFHLGSVLLKEFKKIIEKPDFFPLGFFGGLAEISFVINLFCKRTGCYFGFHNDIYNYLLTLTNQYIDYCSRQIENLKFYHYDAISGLSGIGYYLVLNYQKNGEEESVILKIVDYLHQLSQASTNLPLWHISTENQATRDDILNYPDGHLNFSLSHGITGAIAFLSAAYRRGIGTETLRDTLIYYLKYLEDYAYWNGQSVYWPTKVPVKDFLANKYNCVENYSWCYGMTSILRVYELAKSAIHSHEKTGKILMSYNDLFDKSGEIKFKESIVCHGHIGFLCTLLSHHLDYPQPDNEKQILSLFDKAVLENSFIYSRTHSDSFLESAVGELIALLSIYKDDISVLEHLMLL